LHLNERVSDIFGSNVTLLEENIQCIRKRKCSIWRLEVLAQGETVPIILKIYPSMPEIYLIEQKVYQYAQPLLHDIIPDIYLMEQTGDNENWIFMEHLHSLTPKSIQLNSIPMYINEMAKLHTLTFDKRFLDYTNEFVTWLPIYSSQQMAAQRMKKVEKTKILLDEAMKQPHLYELLKTSYPLLQKALQNGPDFFPELIEAGQSFIHGDLHTMNIGYRKNDTANEERVKFIDWGSSKHAPVWFDISTFVELLIEARPDLQNEAEDVRRKYVRLYVDEMDKYGINFKTDPIHLLKMAYLQRALERKLMKELKNALKGESLVKLKTYLKKFTSWGEELGLY
jgi:thiamine kinase-like enzyme